MKKILCALLLLCLAATPALAEKFDAKERFGSDTLYVYNYGEYIDMQVIYDFESEYGVRVVYDNYGTNEEMYTKLMSATYDVLVPSDYMIERLIRENMLQPIDKSVVDNLDNLYEGVRDLEFDPDNTYSVPYLWQNVGIVYDKRHVDPELIEEKGFSIYLDPAFDGHAYMYDSERDSFMMAFKALGYSANTEDPDEIRAAYEWLREVDRTVHPSYVQDEVIDSMANGEKWLAVMYSGDAAYVLSMNENMGYCAPREGTNLCVDCMVIPANAENPGLANLFIRYILEYEPSLMISEETCYASPNAQVLEELSGEDGDFCDNAAYLPRTGYELDEIFHDNEALRQQLSEMWIKVKLHE